MQKATSIPLNISLNPYGVQVRYPNELTVDEAIAGQAINYAEKIFEFCEKKINEIILGCQACCPLDDRSTN
jgi:hypothetical protein